MSATSAVASPESPHAPQRCVQRVELERFFAGIRTRMELTARIVNPGSSRPLVRKSEVERFFSNISREVEPQQRRNEKRWATGFNVFDFIEPDENKLSDVLAWLLAPKGSHGQGDLFLQMLFKELGVGYRAKLTKEATVQREAPTHGIRKYRRRMDVLVEAGVWLVIENKVDSPEQPEQVKDYLEHLDRCASRRTSRSTLIYLTPNGRSPTSLRPPLLEKYQEAGRLHCWSYQIELRRWLGQCRQDCEAPRIRDFLSDFVGYIESALNREAENEEEREASDNSTH